MSEIKTQGFVGGGQLVFLEMQAASFLNTGDRFIVQDPGGVDCPAGQLGAEVITAEYMDNDATQQLADKCDVITYELDHCDGDFMLELVNRGYNVIPDPHLLFLMQDKHRQHRFVQKELGFRVPQFQKIRSEDELGAFMADGKNKIVKTDRNGFDGRGCWDTTGKTPQEVFQEIRSQSKGVIPELYAEEKIDIAMELAVLVAKTATGKMVTYPVLRTEQKDGQCSVATTTDDIDINPKIITESVDMGQTLAASVEGAAFICMELMLSRQGLLYYLEGAPRVHNSHHLTIERNVTSQFAQHQRLLKGWDLGSVESLAPAAAMVNILGEGKRPDGSRFSAEDPDIKAAQAAVPEAYIHLYGKTARRNRKLGHATVLGATTEQVQSRAKTAVDIIKK